MAKDNLSQFDFYGNRPQTHLSAEKIAEIRERDNELVRGVVRNYEQAGMPITFAYLVHKGDRLQKYSFPDNSVQIIPRVVARHISKDCGIVVHKQKIDQNGNNIGSTEGIFQRFGFTPLDFMDIESYRDITPNASLLVTPDAPPVYQKHVPEDLKHLKEIKIEEDIAVKKASKSISSKSER